jgi:lysozyme family protein
MADFEKAVQKTLSLEGGYVNDPADPGGATKYGIAEATARAHGYIGDMRLLTVETAKAIYKTSYWDVARLDEVESQLIAENIFDCNVNCGAKIGGRLLQESLNLINIDPAGRQMWPVITVDGIVGNGTLQTLNQALRSRRDMESLIIVMFNCLRANRYVSIIKNRPASKKFMIGWLKHRVWLEVRT